MRYNYGLIILIIAFTFFSCEETVKEKDPMAVIAVSPSAGSYSTVFVFDATGSTSGLEDGNDYTVRWDWEGDGIFDTEYSASRTRSHKYEEPGEYTPTVQIINSLGWTDDESINLLAWADSIPPIAAFDIIPDDTVHINTILCFNAALTFDPQTPVEEMLFRWDWQSDGIWDTPFVSDTTTYHKYEITGWYRVRLEAKNSYQITDTVSRLVYTYDN